MASDAVQFQVQLVLRLTLGLVFLVSALTKLRDPSAFVRGVLDYQVLPRPLARVYGWLLPLIELSTALLLLSGFFLAVGAGLTVLMVVSFTVAIVINAARGRAPACHCFGESQVSRVGWHTLVRDLLLLAPAIWLWRAGDVAGLGEALDWVRLLPAIGIAVVVALSYALVVESLELFIRVHRETDRHELSDA
ncbi:MAG: MauE/DoxX family redox-associated membrane protein [Chloroflexota bacterium]